jgi:GTP-binding protein HflX
LYGNTNGLSPDDGKALRALYRRRCAREEFVSPGLARALTEVSAQTGRRIGVLLTRAGEVDKVVVGDAHRVFLPDLGRRSAGDARFRSVRLVLSSLRPEILAEDDLTDLSLLRLDAVVSIHVGPAGLPGMVRFAYLLPPEADAPYRVETRTSVHDWHDDFGAFVADLEAQFARSPRFRKVGGGDRAILVGVALGDARRARRGMGELERLAGTAGLTVLEATIQNRQQVDGKTFVGKGKLQELIVRSMQLGAEVLIFDRELSPSQLRNIAESTDLKVLDRTQLILDIFAQHATSREGKLQVELAQLRYRAPRLAIMPTSMSRLTGGIGGRGPGETKLEINKRRADERMTRLERELAELGTRRAVKRARRARQEIPVASIVGYTNAGKSTLLNKLTASEVLSADKLFATLDPTSRRMRFPEAREIVVTDTVGFIEDLPATLVAAFKATLEELEEADLLLHVLDASDPEVEAHRRSVEDILQELGLGDTPTLLVWNKADAADPEDLATLCADHGGIATSAVTGEGCDRLLAAIEHQLFRLRRPRLPAAVDA